MIEPIDDDEHFWTRPPARPPTDIVELRPHLVRELLGLHLVTDGLADRLDRLEDVGHRLAPDRQRLDPERMELRLHERSLCVDACKHDEVRLERNDLLQIGVGPSADTRKVLDRGWILAISRHRHDAIEGVDPVQDLGDARRK